MKRSGGQGTAEAADPLEKAMKLFWSKGFFETSIEDIVSLTGTNRAALYARYGGKLELFERSLELYRQRMTVPMLAILARENASLPEIREFFSALLGFLDYRESRHGCLMCLTASESALHGPEVLAHIDRFLGDLRRGLGAATARAAIRGEIASAVDPAQLADFFLGAVLGAMSLARTPVPREQVRNYLRGVIAHIDLLCPGNGAVRSPSFQGVTDDQRLQDDP